MLLSLVYFVMRCLLQAMAPSARGDFEREVKLLVLRHQLKVLSRVARRPPFRRQDRMLLAAASRILPHPRWRAFVVTPRTLLRWHRELVRRKWTYRHRRPGRPELDPETVELITRPARENPRWGYLRIRGELLKLGVRVSATAIQTVLRRHGLGPAPRRSGPSWSEFLRSQARGILGFDFFTVETAWLRTLYVLFAIELGCRRVHVLGVTRNPDSAWVTQQARNLAVGERLRGARFLIRDRDSKYSGPFDEVFRTEGVKVVKTPIRAPKANAFAERWVRTARRECLDHILILGRRHLERTLREFVGHYYAGRPHRGLKLACPSPRSLSGTTGTVRRRDRLGGLIHEYYRGAGLRRFCTPQVPILVDTRERYPYRFAGRRRTRGQVQALGCPTPHASGGGMCWAGSFMSTSWPLESKSRVCVPFNFPPRVICSAVGSNASWGSTSSITTRIAPIKRSDCGLR